MLKKSDVLALIEALPEEFDEDALWRACSQAAGANGEWVSPDCTLTKEQRDSVHATALRQKQEGGNPIEEVEARFEAWAATFE